jgi:hypothetical protein
VTVALALDFLWSQPEELIRAAVVHRCSDACYRWNGGECSERRNSTACSRKSLLAGIAPSMIQTRDTLLGQSNATVGLHHEGRWNGHAGLAGIIVDNEFAVSDKAKRIGNE